MHIQKTRISNRTVRERHIVYGVQGSQGGRGFQDSVSHGALFFPLAAATGSATTQLPTFVINNAAAIAPRSLTSTLSFDPNFTICGWEHEYTSIRIESH
jgi:hypothetical protein